MNYTFNLVVETERSHLSIRKDGREVASREWVEARDMGRQLFVAIDELLREHGLQPSDVAAFETDIRIPETRTSGRIAETVAKVYTFAADVPFRPLRKIHE